MVESICWIFTSHLVVSQTNLGQPWLIFLVSQGILHTFLVLLPQQNGTNGPLQDGMRYIGQGCFCCVSVFLDLAPGTVCPHVGIDIFVTQRIAGQRVSPGKNQHREKGPNDLGTGEMQLDPTATQMHGQGLQGPQTTPCASPETLQNQRGLTGCFRASY